MFHLNESWVNLSQNGHKLSKWKLLLFLRVFNLNYFPCTSACKIYSMFWTLEWINFNTIYKIYSKNNVPGCLCKENTFDTVYCKSIQE